MGFVEWIISLLLSPLLSSPLLPHCNDLVSRSKSFGPSMSPFSHPVEFVHSSVCVCVCVLIVTWLVYFSGPTGDRLTICL